MTDTKFTPGPWKWSKCGTENALVYVNEDCVVGGVHKGGDDYSMSHADASLIAAAPDLYHACCDIMGFLKSHGFDTRPVGAALRKAEGRNDPA